MRSGFRRTHDVFSWRGAGVPKTCGRGWLAADRKRGGPYGSANFSTYPRPKAQQRRLLLISRYLPNLNNATPAPIRTSRSERARPPAAAEHQERGASHLLLLPRRPLGLLPPLVIGLGT